MAITNNVSVQYNGEFLPRYYTVDPVLLPSGNPIKYHEEFLSSQPMFLPSIFPFPPPNRVDAQKVCRRSDFSLKNNWKEERKIKYYQTSRKYKKGWVGCREAQRTHIRA